MRFCFGRSRLLIWLSLGSLLLLIPSRSNADNTDELFLDDDCPIVREYANASNDLPDFLQETSPHYRMVAFYDPHCKTCHSNFLPFYSKLAHRMLNYTSLLHVHKISCPTHRSLCSTQDITYFPTIRLYTPHQSIGMPILFAPEHLHPYKILHKLSLLADTSLVRPFLNDQTYFGASDEEDEEDDDADFLRELEEVFQIKRGFAEQDMHFALEQMLRHHTFQDRNVMTLNSTHIKLTDDDDDDDDDENEENDDNIVLLPQVTTTLRDFLDHLRTVVTQVPGSNENTATIGPLVREVRNNMQYVARDNGNYLHTILNEQSAEDWSAGCRMTYDGGSSYLCGLWKLLFRAALGQKEYKEAAIPMADSGSTASSSSGGATSGNINFKSLVQRVQHHVGLLCTAEDTGCTEIVMRGYGNEDDDEEDTYESLTLWLTELRQELQRYLRRRQKLALKAPYKDDDDVVTLYPLKSHCPRCWDNDSNKRNMTVTRAFLELEFGRSVAWKDVLPIYDIVHPEDDDDDDGGTDAEHDEL